MKTLYSPAIGFLALILAATSHCFAWDEVVGKKVIDNAGKPVGYVADTVIDLEHGRCMGVLIAYGGFLGTGRSYRIIPLGALNSTGNPDAFALGVDKGKFEKTLLFKVGDVVGSAQAVELAKIYEYYGLKPNFTVNNNGNPTPLGYLRRGSKLLLMPVKNSRGKLIGDVIGIRGLDPKTSGIQAVLVQGLNRGEVVNVTPSSLRYGPEHKFLYVAPEKLQVLSRSF